MTLENPEADAYVLGTEDAEIARLRFQHEAWTRQQLEILEVAGFRAGQTVVDLGCGPGFTSVEIAKFTGPTGRVIARDTSERFLATFDAELARRGLAGIETSLGPVEDLELAPGSIDGAYSRWLLSWLADAEPLVHHVARALRPGGAFVMQEYIDWGAMRVVPRVPAFDRAIEAAMANWHASGQTIDVAERVPELAERAGLRVEVLRPVARTGAVGSLEWRWIGAFLEIWLPKLVATGAFDAEGLAAWRDAWSELTAGGFHHIVTPIVADVVLRKP